MDKFKIVVPPDTTLFVSQANCLRYSFTDSNNVERKLDFSPNGTYEAHNENDADLIKEIMLHMEKKLRASKDWTPILEDLKTQGNMEELNNALMKAGENHFPFQRFDVFESSLLSVTQRIKLSNGKVVEVTSKQIVDMIEGSGDAESLRKEISDLKDEIKSLELKNKALLENKAIKPTTKQRNNKTKEQLAEAG